MFGLLCRCPSVCVRKVSRTAVFWALATFRLGATGCGSKLNHQGTADFSPCFLLPVVPCWGYPIFEPAGFSREAPLEPPPEIGRTQELHLAENPPARRRASGGPRNEALAFRWKPERFWEGEKGKPRTRIVRGIPNLKTTQLCKCAMRCLEHDGCLVICVS